MHRIDTPSAQVDKFGAGKNGFTRGNPQTGVPSTALDDDYFDAIQEEIAGVIESTGAPLNKNNRAQLLAAINTIIANGGANFLKKTNNLSEIKDAGPAAVEQTLTNIGLTGMGIGLPSMTGIDNFDFQTFVFTSGANYIASSTNWLNVPTEISYPAGLAISIKVDYVTGTQIGLEIKPSTVSSSNFRAWYVRLGGYPGSRTYTAREIRTSANKIPASGTDVATNAEMQVGTADKLVSLVGLMSVFGKRTFSENDYIRIPDVPGGLIIQWMKINNFPANAFQTVTLPTAMPHQLLNVVSTMYYGSLSASAEANARVTDFTLTSFRAAAGLSYTTSQTFIAIGY
ncbi:gp53-like domain-containing protein [Yersinia sp. 2542 StPb PI]|uniref:gp53-like domain-containing protein n=1 Tax=unclassified Yersinia (in: enterobacteria) TaxID=2653513 RepID=UPI003B27F819